MPAPHLLVWPGLMPSPFLLKDLQLTQRAPQSCQYASRSMYLYGLLCSCCDSLQGMNLLAGGCTCEHEVIIGRLSSADTALEPHHV